MRDTRSKTFPNNAVPQLRLVHLVETLLDMFRHPFLITFGRLMECIGGALQGEPLHLFVHVCLFD